MKRKVIAILAGVAAVVANPDVARARTKAARRHMEPGLRTERNENP